MLWCFWVSYWSHLYNFQHFHSCNFTITIQVIHVEGPVQLLLKTASWGDGQGTNELSEVDGPISVFIKGSEGVLGKLRSISIWKELQNKTIYRTVLVQRRELYTWGFYEEWLVNFVENWGSAVQGSLTVTLEWLLKRISTNISQVFTSFNINICNTTLKLN